MLKIKYFAWVRERTGLEEETVEVPEEVGTAGDLIRWLSARGDNYQAAFEEPAAIRIACDRLHVAHDAPLEGVEEVAFFPPMTGG